jgi:hypothetical protein
LDEWCALPEDEQAGEAETVLNTVQYHGEKRQWNFEKDALMHLRQHLILEALMAHGYVGIDPEI